MFERAWFLFVLKASMQEKEKRNNLGFFFNLSPFCSCAVGGPRAWRQICSMASELGAGDDGSSTELAKPLYLQYLERALRLDHFLRQTSAIFNRNISRCVILSLDSVLLHFWFLSLGFKVKLVWFLLLVFSSSFFHINQLFQSYLFFTFSFIVTLIT